MTPDNPAGDPAPGTPRFDPRRSDEIRSLLTTTVAGAPKPRMARLSRTRFALAATAALLFAGGAGAGSVLAYDALSSSVVAQNSSAESAGAESAVPEFLGGTPTFGPQSAPMTTSALMPFLAVNGQTGFAYQADIDQAQMAAGGAMFDAQGDAESSSSPTQVPIYTEDGSTVLGYYEFAPQGSE